MDNDVPLRERIKESLTDKGSVKLTVHDNTSHVLKELKEVLHEMCSEINDELEDRLDKRIKLEYRDRGKFEAQITAGEDIIIFSMHTNVFEFNREHPIWENAYVQQNPLNSYCGMISIYNFLADSFKYNRNGDEGYLIGRIFINREMKYFVEGKRQVVQRHADFSKSTIDRDALIRIVETAVTYALDFDLLVPPYERDITVTVEQMNARMEHPRINSGKRLGYKFNSDDV